jgi:hypothetical protein
LSQNTVALSQLNVVLSQNTFVSSRHKVFPAKQSCSVATQGCFGATQSCSVTKHCCFVTKQSDDAAFDGVKVACCLKIRPGCPALGQKQGEKPVKQVAPQIPKGWNWVHLDTVPAIVRRKRSAGVHACGFGRRPAA